MAALASPRPSTARRIIIRLLLVVTMIFVISALSQWSRLERTVRQAQDDYATGRHQAVIDHMAPVIVHPLSMLKLRPEARRLDALARAALACEQADRARTHEAWTRAIEAIQRAKALAGPSAELDRRAREYNDLLDAAFAQ